MKPTSRRSRSQRSAMLVTTLVLGPVFLAGCDKQQTQNMVRSLAPALQAMAANGGATATTATMTGVPGGYSPYTGSPRTNYGPTTRSPSGGLPTRDSSTRIPSFGRNPSKTQINQMLEAASRKYGIPVDILKGVAYQESGWRADAKSFDGGHGKGIMQIDDRFHEFAKTSAVWDAAKNIDYGAKYLRGLYDKTGSWTAALKRYNGSSRYPPLVMAHAQRKPWSQWV